VPNARSALDIAAAYQTVMAVAGSASAFTTDDVWARLGETSDGRAIANALAEAEGRIRNSRIGVHLRGRQKHRRWLTIWLSTYCSASDDDALAYARSAMISAPSVI
jgi:hypothetical protein